MFSPLLAARAHRGGPGRHAHDLVERTRWLFFVCSGVSVLLTVGGGLSKATPVSAALVLGTAAVFATTLTYRYRTRRAPLVLDGVDVAAALVLAAACPQPPVAFGITYAILWFRTYYGRPGHVVAYALGMCAAMAGALPLWHLVPGHDGLMDPAMTLGTLPSLLLNGLVARFMGINMFARRRAQQRDAALTRLGTALLGVTDPDEIHQHAWEATAAICAATPGLRVLAVISEGDHLRVTGTAGRFAEVPATLPNHLAPPSDHGGPQAVADATLLNAAAGCRADAWLRVPLPEERDAAYLYIGAAGAVPEDGRVALQSMVNQVALAMRNSEAHRDLEAQALTDALTGLPNRAAFTAAVEESVAAGGDVWAVFVDLDDFKIVNDGMGHTAGDQLLRHVADRLASAIRAEDVCARLGGDEFAVLLRGADEQTAWTIGQRLVELSSAPVTLEGRLAQVGASVGIAALEPGMSEVQLVQHADIAMYAAKAAGKNRVMSFQPTLLNVDETVALEEEFRAAVEQGQLVVVYQPILSSADSRCTAVEALVRWQHPARGLLAPIHFLDIAERTGLIVPMGEQVLRRACADARDWQDAGQPLTLHVNASPAQLAHPDFLPVVQECLAEHRLPPERLTIEITESSALDSPAARAAVHSLAGLGVGIAVDDFGTGYAALTALRDLPIDVVKIDRSFVAGAATELADRAVLQAVAEMAGRMGLQTVAEGVEDADQQRFVTEVGVTGVQGYLHLPPVPAAALAAWLGDPARRSTANPELSSS